MLKVVFPFAFGFTKSDQAKRFFSYNRMAAWAFLFLSRLERAKETTRSKRDSNPRYKFVIHSISNRALSATQTLLHEVFKEWNKNWVLSSHYLENFYCFAFRSVYHTKSLLRKSEYSSDCNKIGREASLSHHLRWSQRQEKGVHLVSFFRWSQEMIQHLRQATAQSKTLEEKTNQDRHIKGSSSNGEDRNLLSFECRFDSYWAQFFYLARVSSTLRAKRKTESKEGPRLSLTQSKGGAFHQGRRPLFSWSKLIHWKKRLVCAKGVLSPKAFSKASRGVVASFYHRWCRLLTLGEEAAGVGFSPGVKKPKIKSRERSRLFLSPKV